MGDIVADVLMVVALVLMFGHSFLPLFLKGEIYPKFLDFPPFILSSPCLSSPPQFLSFHFLPREVKVP